MQHNSAAAAVDVQHCADAIIDAVDCLDHCFCGARNDLPDNIKLALRVVRIYSTNGSPVHRNAFENAMLKHPWRGEVDRANVPERVINVGLRRHWGLVVMSELAAVDTILTRIKAP